MRHYVSATVDGRMAMLLHCHVISDSGMLPVVTAVQCHVAAAVAVYLFSNCL